ncbi:pentatricopeptide repeat-containing protein ELI1, chloroplastic-like [Phragmites australis]|uniref:pentatricopeptide repeat-containing protein ELI1, chloroplastic-like n=1 Tax=Phragmites australis TaxID=29695 RepID=UPI002D79E56F|nr:pentatricopeptide repeat-containing protein ELI1, chloroplastic-like [Phragmites australis]
MPAAAAPTRHSSASGQHGALTADRAAALLAGCACPRRASELHAAAVRAGVDRDRAVDFRLQRAYAASGRLDLAVALLRRTPDPTAVFYTSTIHAHSSRGLHLAALALLSDMLSQGLLPTAHTLSASLPACSGLALGRALHGYAFKLALSADSYVATALLGMYARAGDAAAARALFDGMLDPHVVSVTAMLTCYAKMGALDDARNLFDGLPTKDFICWNAMIDGYTQHGRPDEALRLFRRMLRSGVEPDEVSVVLALSAVAQLGTAESGKWLHSYVKNSPRARLNARVGTALIDMYYKCGSLEDAVVVFDGLTDKDIVAWNAMINGYAMHGHSREALEMFFQLRAQGLLPTDITFIGLLHACSHSGLVAEGRKLFKSMEQEYGIEPKIEHYGCMVDLLGRAGLIEEAFDLAQSVKMKPDAVMWVSLLAACRLHKNLALGQRIADYLVARGLANSGMYILLSNIYAAVGKWQEVGRVRSMMKASGIHKEPGCSSIEVGRQVYEFVAGDMSHPRTDEIYAKLEEMNGLAKEHGHAPQTELVLHDLDEATKEKVLAVHSEKLAVSFGLISTPPGTAIKIVKNLRACSDCHAVLKLISKITGRKIVFRDRSRFHHFVDGSCSCGDYW